MKILALELSSGQGSIAWLEDGRDNFVRTFANDRKHSGLFFENLQLCSRERGHRMRSWWELVPAPTLECGLRLPQLLVFALPPPRSLSGFHPFVRWKQRPTSFA